MPAPRRPGVPNAQPSAPVVAAMLPVAAEERATQVTVPSLEQALADLEAAGMSLIANGDAPIKRLRALEADVSLLMRRLMRVAGADEAGDAFDADDSDGEVALIRSIDTTESDPYDLATGAEAVVDDGWTDPFKGAAPDAGYGDEPIRGLDLRSRARAEPPPVIMVKPAVPTTTAAEMAANAELLKRAGDDPYLAAAIEAGMATPSVKRDGAANRRELEARVSALKAKRGGK